MKKHLLLRCTLEDLAKWRAEAKRYGKTLSAWARARLSAVHKEGCGCEACRK